MGPPRFALARLTRRGALDRTFGSHGRRLSSPSPFGGFAKAVLAFGTADDWAGALARQDDGRIVAAGQIYDDQAVARYLGR